MISCTGDVNELAPGNRWSALSGHFGSSAAYSRTIARAVTCGGYDSAIGPVIQRLILRPTTSSAAVAGVPSRCWIVVVDCTEKYASVVL